MNLTQDPQEERELLSMAEADEWATPINWSAERDEWLTTVDGKEPDADLR